jgi:hypothetical protein
MSAEVKKPSDEPAGGGHGSANMNIGGAPADGHYRRSNEYGSFVRNQAKIDGFKKRLKAVDDADHVTDKNGDGTHSEATLNAQEAEQAKKTEVYAGYAASPDHSGLTGGGGGGGLKLELGLGGSGSGAADPGSGAPAPGSGSGSGSGALGSGSGALGSGFGSGSGSGALGGGPGGSGSGGSGSGGPAPAPGSGFGSGSGSGALGSGSGFGAPAPAPAPGSGAPAPAPGSGSGSGPGGGSGGPGGGPGGGPTSGDDARNGLTYTQIQLKIKQYDMYVTDLHTYDEPTQKIMKMKALRAFLLQSGAYEHTQDPETVEYVCLQKYIPKETITKWIEELGLQYPPSKQPTRPQLLEILHEALNLEEVADGDGNFVVEPTKTAATPTGAPTPAGADAGFDEVMISAEDIPEETLKVLQGSFSRRTLPTDGMGGRITYRASSIEKNFKEFAIRDSFTDDPGNRGDAMTIYRFIAEMKRTLRLNDDVADINIAQQQNLADNAPNGISIEITFIPQVSDTPGSEQLFTVDASIKANKVSTGPAGPATLMFWGEKSMTGPDGESASNALAKVTGFFQENDYVNPHPMYKKAFENNEIVQTCIDEGIITKDRRFVGGYFVSERTVGEGTEYHSVVDKYNTTMQLLWAVASSNAGDVVAYERTEHMDGIRDSLWEMWQSVRKDSEDDIKFTLLTDNVKDLFKHCESEDLGLNGGDHDGLPWKDITGEVESDPKKKQLVKHFSNAATAWLMTPKDGGKRISLVDICVQFQQVRKYVTNKIAGKSSADSHPSKIQVIGAGGIEEERPDAATAKAQKKALKAAKAQKQAQKKAQKKASNASNEENAGNPESAPMATRPDVGTNLLGSLMKLVKI